MTAQPDPAALRALVEKATPGPWTPGNSTISWWIDAPSNKSRCWITGHLGADTWHDAEARQRALADRDLIITLRNGIESLLDERAADKARIGVLSEALEPFAIAIKDDAPGDKLITTVAWTADQHRAARSALGGEGAE